MTLLSLNYFHNWVYFFVILTVVFVPSLQAPKKGSSKSKSDVKLGNKEVSKAEENGWDMSLLTLDEMSTTMSPRSRAEVIEERLSTPSKHLGTELSYDVASSLCDILGLDKHSKEVTQNFALIDIFLDTPTALYLPQCLKWILRPCDGTPVTPFDPQCSFWMPAWDIFSINDGGFDCRSILSSHSLYSFPDDEENQDNFQEHKSGEFPQDNDGGRSKREVPGGAVAIDGMEAVSLCINKGIHGDSFKEMNKTIPFEVAALKLDEMSNLRCLIWNFDGMEWTKSLLSSEECDRNNEFRFTNIISQSFPTRFDDDVQCKSKHELVTCEFIR